MVAVIGLITGAAAGSSITVFGVALTTATGALTLAGSLVNIAGSLLLSTAANALFAPDIPAPARPENVKLNTKNATAPRVGHYGVVRVGGNIVFHRAKSGTTYRVVEHGHGEITQVLQTFLNNEPVTIDASGDVTDDRYFYKHHRVHIFTRKGQIPETHYNQITAIWPEWTENHRLDGQWSSLIIRESVPPEQYRAMYPNNEPEITQLAETTKCHDPRTGLTQFTENAALIMADYIASTDGLNQPAAVDSDDVTDAANDSDVLRDLLWGGQEAKFRLGGSYLLNEVPQDVLKRMLSACAGRLWLKPTGKVGMAVGVWKEPEFVLEYHHIIETGEFSGGPDKLDRFNQLPARYTDHSLNHTEVDAEPWTDLDRVADDGGEVMVGPDYPALMSPSHAQTRQVMKIAMERSNPLWSLPVTCKPSALPAFYEPVIRVNIPELGLVGYCEVKSQGIVFDNGNMVAVNLTLDAIHPEAFDLAIGEQGGEQIKPPEDVSEGIELPQNVAAAASGSQVSLNTFSAGIAVAWTAPSIDSLVPLLKFKVHSALATQWVVVSISQDATHAQISSLIEGENYDVKLAFVTPGGEVGPDVLIESVAAHADTTDPAPPTALAVIDQGGGYALVEMTASTSAGLFYTEIFRDDGSGPVSAGRVHSAASAQIAHLDNSGAGTFDWTAQSVNVSDRVSTIVGPITQTIT